MLLDFYLPILKGDLQLCHELETPTPNYQKLNIPISIFSGSHDERASLKQMQHWQNYTTNKFTAKEFNGGHFYYQGIEKELAKSIIQNIENI